MNKDEKAKLNSIELVAGVLTKYNNDLITMEEYAPLKKVFDATSKDLHDALGVQEKVESGSKSAAETAKEAMGKVILKYNLRARVKANDGQHEDLYKALSKPLTYYTQGAKTVAVQRGLDAAKTLKDNLDFLTNIKQAFIDEILAAVEVYNITKNEPMENIHERKVTATDVIPGLFEKNDDAVNDIYDLTFSYFNDSNPDLVNALATAKHVVNTGVRHTGVSFTILDSKTDEPIMNATITDVSNGKIYTTDTVGYAHIETHISGEFHFMIETTGKPTKDFVGKIIRGIDNVFVVKL